MPKIVTKYSTSASAAPTVDDLEVGELAVNLTDRKLYSKRNSSTVVTIADGNVSGTWIQIGDAQVATTDASIDFTSASYPIGSSYSEIMLVTDKFLPTSDGSYPIIRISTDGSNYSSASIYATATVGSPASSFSAIGSGGVGTSTSETGCSFLLRIFNPADDTNHKHVYSEAVYISTTGAVTDAQVGCSILTTSPILGLQVLSSGSSILSGTFTLFGRRV